MRGVGQGRGGGPKPADPANPNTAGVFLRLPPALLATIDALRGSVPRSEWLREAAREKVARAEAAQAAEKGNGER
jgi:hypothetical protein